MKNPAVDLEEDSPMMTSKWQEYELEKAKLRKLDLPYAEYERQLKEIARRLGL